MCYWKKTFFFKANVRISAAAAVMLYYSWNPTPNKLQQRGKCLKSEKNMFAWYNLMMGRFGPFLFANLLLHCVMEESSDSRSTGINTFFTTAAAVAFGTFAVCLTWQHYSTYNIFIQVKHVFWLNNSSILESLVRDGRGHRQLYQLHKKII